MLGYGIWPELYGSVGSSDMPVLLDSSRSPKRHELRYLCGQGARGSLNKGTVLKMGGHEGTHGTTVQSGPQHTDPYSSHLRTIRHVDSPHTSPLSYPPSGYHLVLLLKG